MTYFLKTLQHQELGSTTRTGKAARGKYIYISKNSNILDFFPKLSKDIKNDKTVLKISPIYQNDSEIRECNFVYNNDFYHKLTGRKGKNEYRFYLKKILEKDTIHIEVNDILILKDQISWEPNESGEIIESTVYLLDIVKPSDIDYYELCQYLISENCYGKNTSTAVYNGKISFFDNKLNTISKKKPNDLLPHPKFEESTIIQSINYCLLTGTRISAGKVNNLNIYKINPYDVGNLFTNCFVFSKDIGWAFTNGLFTLSDDLNIIVHPDVEDSILLLYNGSKLTLAEFTQLDPSKENLLYHRENIYGIFKNSDN